MEENGVQQDFAPQSTISYLTLKVFSKRNVVITFLLIAMICFLMLLGSPGEK
jgi:hypothetical protein